MKQLTNVIILLSLLFALGSCGNATDKKSNPKVMMPEDFGVITFDTTRHDFGTVIEGERVTYGFKFTNTGKTNLKLLSVGTSCGCTATDYPHGDIKPGESGIIQITFNSAHRFGMQHKRITVRANTNPAIVTLDVYAQVVENNSENVN